MVLVVAGVVTSLLLSATLLEAATDPWRALFARTRGADIWLQLTAGTDARPLADLGGVTGLAGPYQVAAATVVSGPLAAPVRLWAMPGMPAIGRPLLRQGNWLTAAQPSGVVLEASFAQALHARVGSALVTEGLDGSSVRTTVVGIAATSDQGLYPDQTPGLMWVMPSLIGWVEPVAKHTQEMVGLRLSSPAATGFVLQEAITRLGSNSVISASTWHDVKQSVDGEDPLLGLLLALFGLVALGGAVLAVSNAASGRILVQLQELAMLKTLGFTPGQLVGMLIAEQAALGLAGAGMGVALSGLLTAPLMRYVPVGLLAAGTLPPAGWVVLIAGGTVMAVLLATAVPGWRAGRVWPADAIRPSAPGGRLSRFARAALMSRLPPAVVLGARTSFTRRLPAALTIGGLALPMMMGTIGIGFWATLDTMQRHPAEIGLAGALSVRPGELSEAQTSRIVAADREAAAVYPWVKVSALLPGETSAITTIGAGTSARPYPFHVADGRLYHAPGEAVATQSLLDAVHLQVGEYMRMPVGGVYVIFHIVGRIIEPEYGGQVIAYGIDTLTQAGAVPPPFSYRLVLRPGVSLAAAEAHLLRASRSRLAVAPAANPAASLGIMRPMLAGLFAVLGLIALTSVLTAAAVGLRDHLRDIGALRAMGLTPRQIMISFVTRVAVLAFVAALAGAVCGLVLSARLIDLVGQAYGIGAGLGSAPSAGATLTAMAIAVVAAGLAAIVPAARATRTPIATVLRPY